jgi:hypothetical protein
MLRAERGRNPNHLKLHGLGNPRELLLAVAPPPRAGASSVAGWPQWLVPAFRASSDRHLAICRLEKERRTVEPHEAELTMT